MPNDSDRVPCVWGSIPVTARQDLGVQWSGMCNMCNNRGRVSKVIDGVSATPTRALDFPTSWFGTRRSKVQILSPRPFFPSRFITLRCVLCFNRRFVFTDNTDNIRGFGNFKAQAHSLRLLQSKCNIVFQLTSTSYGKSQGRLTRSTRLNQSLSSDHKAGSRATSSCFQIS